MSSKTNKNQNQKQLKNKTTKVKGGMSDLTQKYSLEILDQGGSNNGFSFINILLGLLAVGTLVYIIKKESIQQ